MKPQSARIAFILLTILTILVILAILTFFSIKILKRLNNPQDLQKQTVSHSITVNNDLQPTAAKEYLSEHLEYQDKKVLKGNYLELVGGISIPILASNSGEDILTPAAVPSPKVDIQLLFSEDVAKEIRQSEPDNINLPLGLQATLDIEYLGAFRVNAGGESGSDWAVGTLGFNPDNNSLFMAGHAHHNAIAEFKIPSKLSFSPKVANISNAAVLQKYVKILAKKDIGNKTNKINGMLYYKKNLLVSSEIWYDGNGGNRDNLQIFSNAHNISSSDYKGMLQVEGAAKAAGYMFKVPAEMQGKIGSEYLIGWASNYSITGRYSQGPSLYRFDPNQAMLAVPSVSRVIDTEPLMVFPLEEGKQLVEGGQRYKRDISPIWGPMAKVRYGFIIPGTSYFLAVGSHSGLHSGVGYKITQDNGYLCGGPCSYESADRYNYFWIFDVDEILKAEQPWLVQPISYGKWSHPYDRNGAKNVIGGAFDLDRSILYLALSGAGQTRPYENVPLIISYHIEAKKSRVNGNL